ncbi:MAG TPA: hypothetical protein VGX48_11770 [Pyrinomonadaceae bacterium]|jgi:hypothetical protein|nr:hypothetical protein [Pyrinomonadaceae bacterium]
MSSFSARVAGSSVTRPDPAKHVNYSLGMVLGVDDFTQEFAYLSGRDQWLGRDLVGYGTVSGLAVSVAYDADARAEVVITPGAALSPRGQLIRVTPTQCADLGDWLSQERNRARLDLLPSGATALPVYVVLSYRECATDEVPIPGEPCRSEEDSMEASRLADNFRLELSFDPPDQREDDALRDFVRWLSQWVVAGDESTGTFADIKQFERAVRGAAEIPSPPTSPPDFMYGSPPAALRVRASDACEFLRAALRIWVTELRPLWGGAGQTAGLPPNEEGVLLAELTVPVRRTAAGDRWELEHPGLAKAAVNEGRRPFVLHLRMLQEWVECGSRPPTPADTVEEERAFGLPASSGASKSFSRADHTHGTPDLVGDAYIGGDGRTVVGSVNGIPVAPSATAPPVDGQVLLYASNRWVGADAPPLPLAGDVTGSSNDNELSALKGVPFVYNEATARQGQMLTYMLVETGEEGGGGEGGAGESSPALSPIWVHADLTLQGATIAPPDPSTPLADGQVLTFVQSSSPPTEGHWQAAPLPDITLDGDVTGEVADTSVNRIQGEPVANFREVRPQNGELLTYSIPDGQTQGSWTSQPPGNLAGDVVGPRAETSVRRLFGTDLVDLSAEANRPQDGQVLTWTVPDEATPGRWQARTPESPDIALDGDVTGARDATTVVGLRGTAIADFSEEGEGPSDGDVLVFSGVDSPPLPAPRWRALAPGGDVTGPLNASTVSAIKNVPVGSRPAAAPYNDGDVLVFRGGTWTPEALPQPPRDDTGGDTTTSTSGSFVGRPAGQPAYSIVAAGIIPKRAPVYGGLRVAGIADGSLTVTFDGYTLPEKFQYVVMAMPVVAQKLDNLYGTVITFAEFNEKGFVLRVINQGRFVSAAEMEQLEFMIEVSRFEAGR